MRHIEIYYLLRNVENITRSLAFISIKNSTYNYSSTFKRIQKIKLNETDANGHLGGT